MNARSIAYRIHGSAGEGKAGEVTRIDLGKVDKILELTLARILETKCADAG